MSEGESAGQKEQHTPACLRNKENMWLVAWAVRVRAKAHHGEGRGKTGQGLVHQMGVLPPSIGQATDS